MEEETDTWIRLTGTVTPATVRSAASRLAGADRAQLVVFEVEDTDLTFLTDLPPLHDLRVLYSAVKTVDAIAYHAKTLQTLELMLGWHPVTVQPLAQLHALRQLYLSRSGRPAVRDVPEALAHLRQLEHLILYGTKMPSLEDLASLPKLTGLALKVGSITSLDGLADLTALRFFEAWQVRGLSDLTPVAASPTLEVLYLESLRRAELPDFSTAVSLQHVKMDNLPLTAGLAGLAAAPRLRQVSITRRVFSEEEVAVLRGHPSLEAAFVPLRGRGLSDEDFQLGLRRPDEEPFTAYAAGVMGLPNLHEPTST